MKMKLWKTGSLTALMAPFCLAAAELETYMVVNLAERDTRQAVTWRAAPPEGGWTVADRTTNIVFRRCEPGTFRMGCVPGEKMTPYNSLAHDVTLTKAFYLGIFQLTQGQLEQLRLRNPSLLSRKDCAAVRPADNLTWKEAVNAAQALGRRVKRTGFGLPTSAQWEYAARAGETGRVFPGDPCTWARCGGNIDKSKRRKNMPGGMYLTQLGLEDGTAAVGSYRPNAWGIYDVLGNGREWCRDAPRAVFSCTGDPETDPVFEGGVTRLCRGSWWDIPPAYLSLSDVSPFGVNEKSAGMTCRLAWFPDEAEGDVPAAEQVTLAADDGSLGFAFTLCDGEPLSFDLSFADAARKPVRVTVKPGDQVLGNSWEPYRSRVRGLAVYQETPVPEAKVVFTTAGLRDFLNFDYALLPYFDNARWNGLYDTDVVTRDLPAWLKAATPLREKAFRVELRHDPSADRIEAYVDGQYAGAVTGTGPLAAVTFSAPAATCASVAAFAPTTRGLSPDARYRPLDPQPNALRVNPRLAEGASVELPAGYGTDLCGVPFRVWKPEESFDQGRHRETCRHDDIMYWGMLNVDGFRNGPEFLQYNLPQRPWSAAWVLCCALSEPFDLSETKAEPLSGVEFGVYGSTRGKLAVSVDRLEDDLRRSDAADFFTNRAARIVGSVRYRGTGGHLTETPLWLVRQRLDYGHVFAYAKGSFGLGFVGGGTWDGSPRSNVQVFGCTLEMSPVDFAVEETVRGNIFAAGDTAETAVRLTATRDRVKGRLEWIVRDPNFAELRRGGWDWSFATAGESRQFTLDLGDWPEGWYALDWRVIDGEGVEQIVHEAAFTQLGTDTREAGFESPYAAWPQLGRHETNPNRAEQLAMLHKAGFHKGWHEAVTNETEYPDYKYTFTEYCAKLDGMSRVNAQTTDERLVAFFQKDVDGYRQLKAKFPHLNTISIFHEEEPRRISHELRGEFEPEHDGIASEPQPFEVNNRNRVRYLTAFCRHMHATFPGVRLRIANNSAASERVALFARAGFDLNLVDELGSEVLAFRVMPELAADHAAPGSMWALRETGRFFGMTNAQVGASSEFVFRPERRVNRADPRHLRQTAYAVRDYLISLGFGCPYVSSGHLEDCFSAYYDSDWGASGQCRPYPLSYPKRIYTAIATLTKTLDKPVFSRRVPTGENTAYALEFLRDRTVKDYVYALWTPTFDVELSLRFPAGTPLTLVDAFGRTETVEGGALALTVGELPRYVISPVPALAAEVTGHPVSSRPDLEARDGASVLVDRSRMGAWRLARPTREGLPGLEGAVPGVFSNRIAVDDVHGEILECALDTNGTTCPKIFSEFQVVEFRKPVYLSADGGGLGLWVRGNGSFGRIGFLLRKSKGDTYRGDTKVAWAGTGYVDFHGWQYLTAPLGSPDARESFAGYKLVGVIVGSARWALDPLEMTPVTAPVALGEIYFDPTAGVVRNPDDDWVSDRQRTRLPGWF